MILKQIIKSYFAQRARLCEVFSFSPERSAGEKEKIWARAVQPLLPEVRGAILRTGAHVTQNERSEFLVTYADEAKFSRNEVK
ncbi:hypothetical protein A2466_00555 [Candidatus Falkowbacteria bacterium RIFOXYC2_FULL_34_220]|nr:MAG: hypothetical protein A2466_00555 [Candidatus Falkowbacteria bacterium RIFOXYC2_FULL_34_220]